MTVPTLLWDASALAKRYVGEAGSDTVNALFAVMAANPPVATFMTLAETAAILRRKLNRQEISLTDFSDARDLLRQEVLADPNFLLLTIEDDDFLGSIALTDAHSLNSSDAALLRAYLRYIHHTGMLCVLIPSDARLLRAAAAEGLRTLNPETVPAADVPAVLSQP